MNISTFCIRSLTLATIAALLPTLASARVLAEKEPNNSRAQAQGVNASLYDVVNGTMSSNADVDYYKVNAPAGECVTVKLQPNPSGNYDLTLTDSSGRILKTSKNGTGQADFVYACNVGTVVYAYVNYVSGPVGSAGSYSVEFTD